uniref:DDE Tnp4 domain-containing protein n=1 Tax=Panagrolaimus davidi TaxID=227884 RepID=A0A914PIU8_9BILA
MLRAGYDGGNDHNNVERNDPDRQDIDIINMIAEEEEEEFNELQEILELADVLQLQLNWQLLIIEIFNRRSAKIYYHRRLLHNTHFRNATGFTYIEAEELLLRIGHRIRRPTMRNWAATTPQIFLMALRMLRTGNDFWNCGMFGGFSKATAHRCFWQFIEAVLAEMSDLVTLDGTEDAWKHQANIYYQNYGISHVVGSVDGTYIKIRNIGDRTRWRCRRHFPAINMMLMVDASGLIRFISCRWPGSFHDSMVYRNTDLFEIQRTGPDRWQPFEDAMVLADSAYIGIIGDNLLLPHPRYAQITAQNAEFYA